MNDQPVEAYTESRIEQTYRWMRTHQQYVRGVILSMAAITLISLLAAYLINNARYQKEQALHNEERARQEATELYQLARGTTESLLLTTSDRLSEIPDATDLRQELLQQAAQAYERMTENHSNDAGLQRQSAGALMGLAAVQRKLAQSNEAVNNLKKAIKILSSLSTPTDAKESEVAKDTEVEQSVSQLAKAYIELSRVQSDAQRDQPNDPTAGSVEALESCVAAIRLLEKYSERPNCPPHLWQLRGEAFIQKAIIEQDRNNTLGAIEANQSAIQSLKKGIETVIDKDQSVSLRHQAARALLNLAISFSERNETDPQIQTSYEEALQNLHWCIEHAPSDSTINQDLALVHNNLAEFLLHDQGNLSAAQNCYRNSLEFFQKLSQKHPLVTEYKNGLILAHLGMGYVQYRGNALDAALQHCDQACEIADQLLLQNSVRISYRTIAALARFTRGELLTDNMPDQALNDLSEASKLLPPETTSTQLAITSLTRDQIDSQIEIAELVKSEKQLDINRDEQLAERLDDFIQSTSKLKGWRGVYNSACYISDASARLLKLSGDLPRIQQALRVARDRVLAVLGEREEMLDTASQDPQLDILRTTFPDMFKRKPQK